MRETHLLERLLLSGLLLAMPRVAAAQNANDVISLFRGLAQTAIVQSTLFEWQKLPKDELACIARTLGSRGESVQSLIQQGIQPTDRRVSDIRASCLSQPAQRVASGNEQSVYVVDGLQLGGRVQQDSSAYRQYQCSPSEQFSGFTWCQKKTKEPSSRGQYSSSYSILHSQGGAALYVNRYLEPAWFSGNEASDDINRLSKKYGAPTRTIPMPRQSSVPNGMIATWGNVVLEPLDPHNVGQLAIGRDVRAGLMIDHIGDYQRSAQLGLPIYRLTGGAGYVWAASWGQRGVGTLRFLTIDASAINAQISNDGAEAESGAAADREQVGQTPPIFTQQDSNEKARADALATENNRLVEAQKAVAEESNRKRIADVESAKLTAQALDNSRRAAEEARAEALQAKREAEVASENAREQSQLYLMISGGVIIILIIALALLAFSKRRNLTVSHARRETSAVPNSTSAKGLPEPVLLTATSENLKPVRSDARVIQPVKAIFWITVSVAGFSYALSPDVRAFVDHHVNPLNLLDRIASQAIFKVWAGPNLKVWTQEVYLDPTATKAVLVLNIQSRMDTPVVLTSVSVNDDPKCFPEYAGGNSERVINVMNGIMQIMLKSQGISILRDGYSRELKLGEIEKLSLGSPSLGGCTPVKAVITTDHGSSTFNFE
jgi:hypothetical protein